MNIGDRIKEKRIEKKLTQRELADLMQYSNHSTIARIESGAVDIPQSRIVQFAEVLGTTVSYLMGWEDVQKKNDVLSDIVLRMRNDDDFLSVVEKLYRLDAEKLKGVNQLLDAFLK